MFYQDSASRLVLDRWVRELLTELVPAGQEARTLDEITTAEILDLAYVEGGELDASVVAHALFPTHVEQAELRRSAPSAMEVSFPVRIEEESCRVSIYVRWGRASELVIGKGGTPRVRMPAGPVPDDLLKPRIGGTSFRLSEEGGERLRSLAGPMRAYEATYTYTLSDAAEGENVEAIDSPGEDRVYAYIDRGGAVQLQRRDGNLEPLPVNRDDLRDYFLYAHALPAAIELRCRWRRISANELTFSCSVRNVTPPLASPVAGDALLQALLLPHVSLVIEGGVPDFPHQQYTEAKAQLVAMEEADRLVEASRRLYTVRQSGCVVTRSTARPATVWLTTFGVFDTPRERPLSGPEITDILAGPDAFLAKCPAPSARLDEFVRARWPTIRAVCDAAKEAFELSSFHQFQWDAIVQNLQLLAERTTRPVTIIRAPTGAGKTIAFMVNAAVSALCSEGRASAVLFFPTRILNEDMFRRLTRFVFQMRRRLPKPGIRGGILMGTSDPLYRLLLNPSAGEAMHHYGACPACAHRPLVAQDVGGYIWPKCERCGHTVDYMDNPRSALTSLPDIIIATPDKLFYEATVQGFEQYRYGLFGAPVRRCLACRKAITAASLRLKPKRTCEEAFPKDNQCSGLIGTEEESKPIAYMGFDEIHSLYGEIATYLSMFLAALEAMQRLLTERRDIGIRIETATATISNETELLEAITRRHAQAGEIIAIPSDEQMPNYFVVEPGTVRYRVLVTLPTRISSRDAFNRAVLNSYIHLRTEGDLVRQLREHCSFPEDWRFLLGYVFRKQEGLDLRRTLRDYYRNTFGETLRVEFLSGDAPKNQISRILHEAVSQQIDILLANLVISLGMDIHGLNHMIMLGFPRSFTEFVQTAGRTGRAQASGHVSIILQPYYPRDAYLYRHFHAVLSDVSGYYDVLPVSSTNLHCAEQAFGNMAKAILSALCLRPSRPQWSNRRGLEAALGGMTGPVEAGLTKILCDDPALVDDIRQLVATRLRALLDYIGARNGFLSSVLGAGDGHWLIRSLRGQTGEGIRITCMDQLLAQRLAGPSGLDEEEAEDEPRE